MNCPYCNNEIRDENAAFCPHCGRTLRQPPPPIPQKTGFPIAGGILTIIASCICVVWGIIGLLYITLLDIGFLLMGIFGIFGFAFGLTAGIFTLKRIHFGVAIVGACFPLVSGAVNIVPIGYRSTYAGLLFGLPILILSLLGLIFTTLSKREFR